MGFLNDTWQGFTNYLSSTKEEVVSEWDEFQEEMFYWHTIICDRKLRDAKI